MEFLNYLVKSAGILTLFYVVYILVLHKDTYFSAKRFYLLSGVLAALILPLITFTTITLIDRAPITPMDNINQFLSATTTGAVPVIETTPFNWILFILAIYLIGVSIFLFRFLLQLFSLVQLLNSHESKQVGPFEFIEIDKEIAPFSFFNYIVFNPCIHSPEELKMILQHEKIHASQWHSIDLLSANLMRAFQWVNPISWFYKRSLEANLEFLADTLTVDKIDNKKHYQLTLVKASSALPVPALTNNFYQSFIKKRIIMLNKTNSNKYQQLKLIIVLPLLVLFLWSFNTVEVINYTETKADVPITKASSSVDVFNISEENVPLENAVSIAQINDKTSSKVVGNVKPKDHRSNQKTNTVSAEAQIAQNLNDFRYEITSKTTNERLEIIKEELKQKHQTDFSYSIKRDDQGEIINIQIKYTDTKNNSGNYNISSTTPISSFYFYQEGIQTGFGNILDQNELSNTKQSLSLTKSELTHMHKELMEATSKIHQKMIVQNHEATKENLKKLHLNTNGTSVHIESTDDHSKNGEPLIIVDGEVFKGDISSILPDQITSINVLKGKAAALEYGINNINGVIEINLKELDINNIVNAEVSKTIKGKGFHLNGAHITKYTTDKDLENIKKAMRNNGKDFNYKRVKRNARGEITNIKITFNDNKGNKRSISKKSNSNDPIEEILIEY